MNLDKLTKHLNLVNEGSTVPAHEFVSQWRSMRDKGYNLLNDSKFEKDAVVRDKMFKDGKEALKLSDDLLGALKDNVPKEFIAV